MVPKVGEKGVALKVGEKAASHLTPLHAPGSIHLYKCETILPVRCDGRRVGECEVGRNTMRQKFGYGHDNSSNHTYFILNPENWKDEEEELASHKLI